MLELTSCINFFDKKISRKFRDFDFEERQERRSNN